jgi:hypothetical protein
MKILNWLIGNKIKNYLSLGVLVVIGGFISYHVINYKTAIRDAERFKIERDKVIIDNTELKAYNASILTQNDSLDKVIVADKENYSKTIKETQLIINQQRLLIKDKDKLINDMSKNLKCKNIFGKIVDC